MLLVVSPGRPGAERSMGHERCGASRGRLLAMAKLHMLSGDAVLLGERSIKLLVEPLRELSLAVAQGQAFDWRTAEATLYW